LNNLNVYVISWRALTFALSRTHALYRSYATAQLALAKETIEALARRGAVGGRCTR
jgi:hypothetical protein